MNKLKVVKSCRHLFWNRLYVKPETKSEAKEFRKRGFKPLESFDGFHYWGWWTHDKYYVPLNN